MNVMINLYFYYLQLTMYSSLDLDGDRLVQALIALQVPPN